jgi:serine/threonine-protein kinase RsbW
LRLGAVLPILTLLGSSPRLRMAANSQRVEVTLETLLESVDLAESIVMRIAEAAGFSEEDIHKIGMAVREGVINAYNYGNQQNRAKKIQLTIEMSPETMTVRVLDQGKGFELQEVPDPLAEENLLRTSGRGLFLMRAFMDEFTVRPGPNGGAELVMVKRLPDAVSGNGASQPE